MMNERDDIAISVRLNREIMINLEKLLVREGLHRLRVKVSNLAALIVREWLENPILDESKMIYGRNINNPKNSRLTVKLNEEENIKLYEIYVDKYIKNCSSINMLIYNILLQFIENGRSLRYGNSINKF